MSKVFGVSREENRRIGRLIRFARIKAGLSQPELAEKLDCSQQLVDVWEIGDRFISLSGAIKLANVLGLSLDQMFEIEKPERESDSWDASLVLMEDVARLETLSQRFSEAVKKMIKNSIPQ